MIKRIIPYSTLLFILVALASCTSGKNDSNTFFGGKIINPKTKFVVLYSMEKAIDTLFLNKRNKFIGRYKDFEEGLYYFKHGNENQYVYLEPEDSLMLRLNTWDFDESLVFAGKGAERNNILIDIFLEDESDNKDYFKLNNLEPDSYKNRIDAILDFKLKTYNNYKESHPDETLPYFEILKIALTHPLYARIERYPINYVYVNRKDKLPDINASFYDFRKNINYSNDALMYYTPYTRYIRNYLYNIAYSKGHMPTRNEFSSDFTIDLLKVINSKITDKESKNAFLKRTILDHFYKKSSCNINQESFNVFFDLSTNKEDKTLIENLLNDNKIINQGDEIKGFSISDFTNQAINIEDFTINKNSVLLFWNEKYITKAFISTRIPFLQKSFPDLNFALIEIDGNSDNRIKNIDIKDQYYINSKTLKNNFLTSQLHRTILVNKNGIVTNGYAGINSRNIYNQLQELNKNN